MFLKARKPLWHVKIKGHHQMSPGVLERKQALRWGTEMVVGAGKKAFARGGSNPGREGDWRQEERMAESGWRLRVTRN